MQTPKRREKGFTQHKHIMTDEMQLEDPSDNVCNTRCSSETERTMTSYNHHPYGHPKIVARAASKTFFLVIFALSDTIDRSETCFYYEARSAFAKFSGTYFGNRQNDIEVLRCRAAF